MHSISHYPGTAFGADYSGMAIIELQDLAEFARNYLVGYNLHWICSIWFCILPIVFIQFVYSSFEHKSSYFIG